MAIPDTPIVRKLIESRTILLMGAIQDDIIKDIAEYLIVMDNEKKAPIKLLINSVGGYIDSGLALIDIMHGLRSQVYTIISGNACSMAGLISVCGHKRYITKNSVWMGHESMYEESDYISKLRDRHRFYVTLEKRIDDIFKQYTKLTKKDLKKLHSGELWLTPEQCLEKGIVDQILK
jgi:ATP-dependent Clp protease protease subunit